MRKFTKVISLFTAASVFLQSIFPTFSFASVSGPSQPEFSSFQAVNTENMVNPFSGDLNYSIPVIEIPGANGGGYALSLSYQSGAGMEQEASWVGCGWTLNPGVIMRNKQGFADDIDGGTVKYYNKTKKNWTLAGGTSGSISVRAFGIVGLSAGLTGVIQYNNYKGLSTSTIPYVGYQLGLKTTTISVEDEGEIRYSYSYANPMSMVIDIASSIASYAGISKQAQYKIGGSELGASIAKSASGAAMKQFSGQSISSSQYAAYTLHNKSIPNPMVEYASSKSYRVSLGGYYAPSPLPIGLGASIFGTYNYQTTDDTDNDTFYGYLYSHNATDNASIMDYVIERNSDFNPRDEIMSTSFSSPDHFSVVGEGLSGTIRAYSENIGEFRPKEVVNETEMTEVGVHVNAGLNISGSVSTCSGSHTLSVKAWEESGNSNLAFSDDGNEPYFFRFIGDLGGNVSMSSSDRAQAASLSASGDGYKATLSSSFRDEVNDEGAEDVGRSSYVGYHTHSEMELKDSDNNKYKRYSFRSDIESLVDRSETDRIGEFAITNKQGNRYVYALPVYAKNEKNISVSVSSSDTSGNYLAYHTIATDDVDTKLGQQIDEKYAISYLITEITSPNYIDREMDGPTDDDFGGWTKFNYTKLYGDDKSAGWYHWRMPWKGLTYDPREISQPDDDLGTFASGDKEIYYVESIETETHIAKFEISSRKDGIAAEEDETASSSSTIDVSDNNKLRKLDQITLYAKNSDGSEGEVIKRVYFEYDYSLCQGQPNTTGTYVDDTDEINKNEGSGKLTLKKVWFEYGDVRNAKISPYVFYYEYPRTSGDDAIDFPEKIKYTYEYDDEDSDNDGSTLDNVLTDSYDEYALLEDYADTDKDGDFDLDENPDYDEANIDPWGNYRANGQTRAADLENWVDQTPNDSFDPAAYYLKRIALPSGGQIIIHYEQNEYSYVQDRRAMAMVSLNEVTDASISDESGAGNYGAIYYLNLDEINANNDEDKEAIRNWIQKIFVDGVNGRDPEKMYFKFSYDVLEDCGNEFISGYANVMETGILEADGRLYVKLGNPDEDEYNTDGGFTSPCDACQEYFKANKGLDIGQDCGEAALSEDEGNDAEAMVLQIIDVLAGTYSDLSTEACQSMDVATSYLRIPVPSSKLGGGVRVKRILRFDEGMDLNHQDAVLYGHEYVYETIEGECSGVATNEPAAIREENALIGYLKKRSEATEDQVLVSGEDKSQFEGPVGENILSSPSIGYSRVVIKNIHSGTTNDGFTVFDHYTTKDFPFDFVSSNGYSGVSYTDIEKEIENPDPSFGFLKNKTYYGCWATQGFCFTITNMNGQIKKTTHYEGDYEDINSLTEINELSSTTYAYFEPGDLIPVMYNHYNFGYEPLGKDVEVICESKKVSETTISSTETIDAGVGIWGPYTIPYAFPTWFTTEDETYLHTYTVNKLIYCPAIVKSVTEYKDGVFKTITNKYYNPLSGDPIVLESSGLYDQQTYDSSTQHEGKYISFTYPAAAYYEEMGQKVGFEKYAVESNDDLNIKYYYLSEVETSKSISFWDEDDNMHEDHCSYVEKFTVGDLVKVSSGSSVAIVQVTSIEDNKVYVSDRTGFTSGISGASNVDVEILQSNRANLLTLSAGDLIMYGEFEEPDAAFEDNQIEYREALAEYISDMANSASTSKPDELAYLAVINPNNGNCSQCDEYDQSEENPSVDDWLGDKLDDMIGPDDYIIDDYQSIIDWAQEYEMQEDFLFDFMDQINEYMDMAATDNCIICDDDREEFFNAENLYDVLVTSYYEWQQDYYFNATSMNSYLTKVISNESLFNESFITQSSLYSNIKNMKSTQYLNTNLFNH